MSEAQNTRSGPARPLRTTAARGAPARGQAGRAPGAEGAGPRVPAPADAAAAAKGAAEENGRRGPAARGPGPAAPPADAGGTAGGGRAPGAEAPLVLMLSAAHPPTDLRIVAKEGAALVEAGWRVTHLAPAPQRGAKDVPASQAGVALVTYPRPAGWLGRLRAARALAARAARLKPDVIHAHEPDSWYAAIKAAGRTGAAVVLDVHEHYPSRLDGRLPRGLRGLGRWAVRAACKWMAARADAVVVAKDGLEDAFPEVGIVPVRNYAAAVPVVPREHRAGPLTLVHLGALTRERGAFEMLHALSQCPGATRLSLIGRFTDGSETEFLSEAKRLGVAGAVERHGWMPHEAAVALAATADIGLVLFQPGHENHRLALPHKLFDCMLAGLPVIVPDFAEEVAAVVRETGCGVLVDTADPATVAEAVRALADPALRAEMGAAGRAAALGRYGWAGEAARLVELYQELAPLPAGAAVPSARDPAGSGAGDAGSSRGAAPAPVQVPPRPAAAPVRQSPVVAAARGPARAAPPAPGPGPALVPLSAARAAEPPALDPAGAFASLSAAMRAAPPLPARPPAEAAPLPPAPSLDGAFASLSAAMRAAPSPPTEGTAGPADAFASLSAAMRGANPLPAERTAPLPPNAPAEGGLAQEAAGAFASLSAAMRAANPRSSVAPPGAVSPAPSGTAPAAPEAVADSRAAGTRPVAPAPLATEQPSDSAMPRLLLDAALRETESMPEAFAALLARKAPERPPGPPVPVDLPPPSRVLGPMPAPSAGAPLLAARSGALPGAGAPVERPLPSPLASSPAAALGSMVRAIRTAAPSSLPAPAPSPASLPASVSPAPFPLLAAVGEAIAAPPPPPAPARPVPPPRLAPAVPALVGRPVEPGPGGERLLAEAGLSGSGVPAGVAAVLARPAEPRDLPQAGPILTSDVPLIEAGLRAAGPVAAAPETPGWRLLQVAPPPVAAPVAGTGR